jgi:hypothetical protein
MANIDTLLRLVGTGTEPAGRVKNDFYQTPAYATEALLEREEFPGLTWEPACGKGAISEVLIKHGLDVYSTDIVDYSYGEHVRDFLVYDLDEAGVDNIITNPPFKQAQKFVEAALVVTRPAEGKVAMLLKLQFLEGAGRKRLLENSPLKRVYVFSKRITFHRDETATLGSGFMAFAWFVWDWKYMGEPTISWIG